MVGPYGPGTMLTSGGMSMPMVRSSIFFRSTRIGQLLTSLGTKKREWHGMEMFLDQQVPADSPLMQQAYANYEENLRDTIRVAQSRRREGCRFDCRHELEGLCSVCFAAPQKSEPGRSEEMVSAGAAGKRSGCGEFSG